jgi:hypothetical protein
MQKTKLIQVVAKSIILGLRFDIQSDTSGHFGYELYD